MFFKPQFTHVQVKTRREFHYWSHTSETFATMSQLYSAVLQGWAVSDLVICRRIAFAGGRRQSRLYYFELRRNDEYMTMPVLENPAVMRLLATESFKQVSYREMPTKSANADLLAVSNI